MRCTREQEALLEAVRRVRIPLADTRVRVDDVVAARAGLSSALMKPTVEKLTMDDMIDLAAYASSLTP